MGILFGGDYNPEQWPHEVWDEDMELFHKASVNTVTLNVFAWALLQKSENDYDFSALDETVRRHAQAGHQIVALRTKCKKFAHKTQKGEESDSSGILAFFAYYYEMLRSRLV